MALPAGPLPTPFIFAVQTTSASGALTTLTSTTSATAAYLEHLIRGFQDAINSRIFCSNAQEWSHLSNRYQMVSKAPLHINPEADRANDRRPMSVRENLDELKRCCEKSSDYRMTFSEMTTEVDEGKGRAVTLALLRVTGMHRSNFPLSAAFGLVVD